MGYQSSEILSYLVGISTTTTNFIVLFDTNKLGIFLLYKIDILLLLNRIHRVLDIL